MDVGNVGANGVRASRALITKVAFEAVDRFTPPRCDLLVSHLRILTSASAPVHEPRRHDSLTEGPQPFATLPGETFALGNREEFHHDPKTVSAANGDLLLCQPTMMGPPGWKYVEYLTHDEVQFTAQIRPLGSPVAIENQHSMLPEVVDRDFLAEPSEFLPRLRVVDGCHEPTVRPIN